MSQPPAHTTCTPARTASGPSRDKRGKRPPNHHTLSLLGSASEMQPAFHRTRLTTLRPRYGLPMTIHARERAGSQH
jgi:hypothetical protein